MPTGGRSDAVDPDRPPTSEIFAETPEGAAMEQRLTDAEMNHAARVSGRLEFGDEASSVILGILERERFDLVVMGIEGEGRRRERHEPEDGQSDRESGHVAASVVKTTACKVVTRPPPALPPDETEAA